MAKETATLATAPKLLATCAGTVAKGRSARKDILTQAAQSVNAAIPDEALEAFRLATVTEYEARGIAKKSATSMASRDKSFVAKYASDESNAVNGKFRDFVVDYDNIDAALTAFGKVGKKKEKSAFERFVGAVKAAKLGEDAPYWKWAAENAEAAAKAIAAESVKPTLVHSQEPEAPKAPAPEGQTQETAPQDEQKAA